MNFTGIIRRLDELGRVVIPMEIRNQLKITEKDPIEIYVDKSCIILKKHLPHCIFCGKKKGLIEYKDRLICSKCAEELTNIQEKTIPEN